jgi:hypothetical protein
VARGAVFLEDGLAFGGVALHLQHRLIIGQGLSAVGGSGGGKQLFGALLDGYFAVSGQPLGLSQVDLARLDLAGFNGIEQELRSFGVG